MSEIKEKRTYTSLTTDNGDGTFTLNAHPGHIHYDNKLGEGDGVKGLRTVDFTLSFDKQRRGWYFKFHNFQPFLPEFADEWVDFRDLFEGKDQLVRYRAVASHVPGRLVMPEEIGIVGQTTVNCVIYDDAFGEGFDYILYFTRSTLKKVVRIRDGFKPKTDVTFDWEVEFPKQAGVELPIFRATEKQEILKAKTAEVFVENSKVYQLDTTADKVFDSTKQMLMGEDIGDGKEWYTYLRGFKVWDSREITPQKETITVDLINSNGATFLRKNITKAFLDKSVGDVFTDTTTSYYSGAGDGYVYRDAGISWANTVDTNPGDAADYTTANGYGFAISDKQANWRHYHGFFPADTSAIGAGATVTAATLNIYQTANLNTNPCTFSIVETSQASTSSLATSDHTAWTKTDIGTGTIATGSGNNTYRVWTFSDLTKVNKSGFTKVGIVGTEAITGTDPGSVGNQGALQMNASEAASNDPYYEITYTPGVAGDNFQMGADF